MDFFVMKFSELFCEKHGEQLFNNICNKIVLENNNNSKEYIELVFKFAFFDFFGLDILTIKNLIKDTMLIQDVNIEEIKSVHKYSIQEIQKYLQSAMNETQKS